MKRLTIIHILLISFCITPAVALTVNTSTSEISPNLSHDFWINPLSSKIYSFQCEVGDSLSGEFVVTLDGEYYIGDQQKYDLWVGWGNGIDFFILDQVNYESWQTEDNFSRSLIREDVISFSWTFEIPASDVWYVIYDNDSSVYGKQVEGSVHHSQSLFIILVPISIIGTILTVSMTLIVWRRKK